MNQSIGDALYYADFEGVDGIVGVGPVDLTQGTLSPDTNAMIPTVMNNLVSQGLIENQVLGVYFAPSTNYSDTSEYSMPDPWFPSSLRSVDGALTYGGIDSSLVCMRFVVSSVLKWLIRIVYSTRAALHMFL